MRLESDGKPLVKEQCDTSPVEFIPSIITQVGLNAEESGDNRLDRWVSNHANWELFGQICDAEMQNVNMNQGVAELNHYIPESILGGAKQAL